VISEVRAGVLQHDVDFLGDNREPGQDISAEVLFDSPGFLGPVFSPRPHLGVSANTQGATSQLYAGLTWTIRPFDGGVPGRFWLSPFFGGTVHNGELSSSDREEKSLGSRVLFRLGAELGVDVTDRISVSLLYEHASNANLAEENEGLNNAGVRVGWRF
jgi:lipid A 3-O-deacylase